MERMLDPILGDEAKERRLCKLHRQPLAKGSVKHRVARSIYEIRQDNCVFLREYWRMVKIEVSRGEGHRHRS
jgi:hypothetical protein